MAGLVRASLDAATIETAVTFATAAAALATESASTVSVSMNANAVRSRLE
jgi:sugar/nucleoside kinase (ribokinase family)